MNIFIPDSWLREHLETKASIKQIAEYLSLSSQSVERIHKKENESIYEIEVTTNRPDCLSVFGIARELSAILPHFKIPAKLCPLPSEKISISKINNSLPLEVKIADPTLCPRFTAIIFDNISICPSPKIIQDRLEKSGVRALNNVVDISNYLMLELGQPMHTFDYDKIGKAKMTLRESKTGESLVTLDGQKRNLPKGTIVIEDGNKKIIDLCGIMGGENSAVDQKTKRVLLFVQTYDPVRIRKTCQTLGFRTDASSRFEKGVEPEGVIPAIKRAVQLFKLNCQTKVAGNLVDIYPNAVKIKSVKLNLDLVPKIIGVEIPKKDVIQILESLGFQIENCKLKIVNCLVPHWRYGDISIPEDLIEEVARVYGYFNLPSEMLDGQIPSGNSNRDYEFTNKIKNALKYWGFSETHSYSLTSKKELEKINVDLQTCLKVSNPISEDWVYLRPSLIPSILESVVKNQNEFTDFSLFEIANIYKKNGNSKLPEETPYLVGVLTDPDFYHAKGVVESLLIDLGIDNYEFRNFGQKADYLENIFLNTESAHLYIKNRLVGSLGKINKNILESFGVKKEITIFYLNANELTKRASNYKKFTPIPKNPSVIEDLSFVIETNSAVGEIIQLIKSVSSIIKSVELIDIHDDSKTFRITYQDPNKNLTNDEIKKVREQIINRLRIKLGLKLKE